MPQMPNWRDEKKYVGCVLMRMGTFTRGSILLREYYILNIQNHI